MIRAARAVLLIVAAHLAGFAFAVAAAPVHAALRPTLVAPPPVDVPAAYWEHLHTLPTDPRLAAALVALGHSLALLVPALLGAGVLGLWLAGRAVDADGRIATWAAPTMALGLACSAVFTGSLIISGWFVWAVWGPGEPPLPLRGAGWDRHLILPTLVLGLRAPAQLAQLGATLLAREAQAPFVIAARSRGMPEWRIRRHVARTVAAPLVMALAATAHLMLAELVIVEAMFAWPGLGAMLADALAPARLSDAPPAAGYLAPPVVALAAALLVALGLVIDGLAAVIARRLDPRMVR